MDNTIPMASSTSEPHPRLPTKPSTTPYWRTQPSPLDSFRSSDTAPEIVDVAIIGSGLSGACVAYHLLSDPASSITNPTIAIFESRQACSGATGRNGGHTKLAPRFIASHGSKYGPAAALEFALFLKELIGEMKECAESVVVDVEGKTLMEECEMLVTRSWDVFLDEEHAGEVEREWIEAASAMREVAKREGRDCELEWLGEVQFVKGENVEKITSIRGAKAAFSCPALSLWPYKFVLGLLQHVLNLGAKLYTLTPVTSMERVPGDTAGAKGLTALRTPRGTTLARKVIFSTNAYASNLLPQYSNTIIPGRGTACRIVRQPSTSEYTQLVNTYNIHGSASSREYLVPRPDGSIILGGGQALYREDKQRWYDMIDDGTLIEGVKEKWFEGYMGRTFRGWELSGEDERVDCVWTGIMGYTEDSFPHVGLVPGETDHFIMAGFNGSGMAMIFLVARGIARMVRGGISFEETGLPAVFKSVQERIKAVGDNAEVPTRLKAELVR
ncbi:related to oxidoreductase [Phialocephala subalpina]|uniref:Related to oxidoreductase n=1 Tax=Phialocephala subalpina TaxID=576137 RepID=A0A1L7XRF5_9HELO|nr:related to oxidoreductase [Phialocephala subalpina]